MTNRTSVRIASALLLSLLLAAWAQALSFNHENTVRFNRAVSLPGVVLPAGSYSFDLAGSALNVVVVRNATQRTQYYMGLTTLVPRPTNLPANATITLGEARATEAPPITVWYPIGGTYGHAFRYQ